MEYYKFPLRIGLLLQDGNKSLPKCSEKESIDQHLELLFGMIPGTDAAFGTWTLKRWLRKKAGKTISQPV